MVLSRSPRRLNLTHVVFVALFHGLALVALFHRPRLVDLMLLAGLYLATGFGVTVGFHRLVAHRGFTCPSWLRGVFVFFGTASLQGGPIRWSTVHRRHHQASDTPADPHSPVMGFLHAHVGWVLHHNPIERGESLVRDLLADPFMRWLHQPLRSALPGLTLAALCHALGGVQGVLWGVCLRTVLVWHATWSVNSFAHSFGFRTYRTPDGSRNLWWVALVALGEGWHNNHHAWPRCAIHGHSWWQFDASALVIRTLQRLGLVRSVVGVPSRERMEARLVA